MPAMRHASAEIFNHSQAAELALLVELEARWENLRTNRLPSPDVPPTTQDLHGKQKAYEAFRVKLAAYNKRYTPAHVPELLLNTPTRLGIWCHLMRDLYLRVEQEPSSPCPVHLLEKAYRWADRLAEKGSNDRVRRSFPPVNLRAAILDLDALGQWCEELARAAAVE